MVGAEEPPVGAAAVVTVSVVPAASGPYLTQRVHAVALPELHTCAVLLQLACTHMIDSELIIPKTNIFF